jgi:hypothetical protein
LTWQAEHNVDIQRVTQRAIVSYIVDVCLSVCLLNIYISRLIFMDDDSTYYVPRLPRWCIPFYYNKHKYLCVDSWANTGTNKDHWNGRPVVSKFNAGTFCGTDKQNEATRTTMDRFSSWLRSIHLKLWIVFIGLVCLFVCLFV